MQTLIPRLHLSEYFKFIKKKRKLSQNDNFLRYGIRKRKEENKDSLEKMPFQLQITYITQDGTRAVIYHN